MWLAILIPALGVYYGVVRYLKKKAGKSLNKAFYSLKTGSFTRFIKFHLGE
jgi:hypothetical protein